MNTYNDEERISAALNRYAASKISNRKNLWPAIRQQISPTSHPRLGFAPAALALLGLLLVGAASYSLLSTPAATNYTSAVVSTPAITQSDPNGLISDAIYPLFTPLNLSQTQNGITVTVRSAYADVNVIAVGYDVETATPDRVVPESVQAAVLEKSAYDMFETRPSPGPISPAIEPAKIRHFVSYFFADPLNGAMANNIPPSLTVMPHIQLERRPDPIAAATIVAGFDKQQSVPDAQIVASFGFKFAIPFQQRMRIANLNQMVVANGITATLASVIVTPGAVEFITRIEQPGVPDDMQWSPDQMHLTAGDKELDIDSGGGPGGEMVYTSLTPAYDVQGGWTLTIPYMSRWMVKDNAEERISGPWIFHFTVPPAP